MHRLREEYLVRHRVNERATTRTRNAGMFEDNVDNRMMVRPAAAARASDNSLRSAVSERVITKILCLEKHERAISARCDAVRVPCDRSARFQHDHVTSYKHNSSHTLEPCSMNRFRINSIPKAHNPGQQSTISIASANVGTSSSTSRITNSCTSCT